MIRLTVVPDLIEGNGIEAIPAAIGLGEAARLWAAGGEGALAVVDAAGRLSGLIDATAIVRALAKDGPGALDRPVGTALQGAVDVLAPGDSGLDALELMRLRAVDHLPVADADGRLLGIVSRRRLCDLLHRCLEREFDRQAAGVFGTPDPGCDPG
ncbi:MAG: CBS domain-containing protein [Rhodospirillales bacterium]